MSIAHNLMWLVADYIIFIWLFKYLFM